MPIDLRSLSKESMQPTFDTLGLSPVLLRAVRELGFSAPTPVQTGAIPPALEGRDVLASAQTGTGKTAAFGLPLLQKIAELPRRRTHALILAPTRELAAQIADSLTALSKNSDIRIRAVFGGVGYGPQAQAFKTGVEIIVATPGRLIDHLQQGARLESVSMLVLDEADRMMDMGFLPAVRRIVAKLPARKQTLFFSATIAPEIAKLSRELLDDPVRIDIAPKSLAPTAEGITHVAYTVDQMRKTDLLVELLKDNNIFSAIAFTRTKARANRLALALEKHGVGADRIHGDRSQAQRTRALADFKRGKLRVLVATDLAARGIDIVDLGHVVNFDVPMVPEDYVHRVGRTARAEQKGDAITFVSHEEEKLFRDIEKVVGRRIDREKVPVLPERTPDQREASGLHRTFAPQRHVQFGRGKAAPARRGR
ncbi:MAG: helicase, superfamily [Candidatus Eremiobacteraeota bacterium]|jgi:ATP-dependent RNA helicase RhlE|nr:helicase, superfamily [Candidatus Eremiobacteraeota bacterium]